MILECHHEFTETELIAFVKENLSDIQEADKLENLPAWLPKRPLIMQLLLRYCLIVTAYGIASHKSLPTNFQECDVENFEALATTTLIKKARLSEAQKLFVQMLRKIFIQPGAGRKEAALLRGMGSSVNRPLGEKILGALLDEKLVTRHKGDEGYIYKPVRGQMGRIDKMLTDLTLSSDPLWIKVSNMS